MKGRECVQSFIRNSLWSLCLAVPVLFEFWGPNKPGHNIPLAASHDWLSLPADLQLNADPLSGWEIFDSQMQFGSHEFVEVKGEPVSDAALESAEPLEPAPARIELLGYVEEGGVPVYCFFDTIDKRWFRLEIDQSDPDSGIKLAQATSTGSLMLIDSLAGERFLLGREELSLQRMDGHE